MDTEMSDVASSGATPVQNPAIQPNGGPERHILPSSEQFGNNSGRYAYSEQAASDIGGEDYDEGSAVPEDGGRANRSEPSAERVGRKINVNSISSGYTVNKIRHLKKEDGEPLWRSDIQHDFLRAIFENEERVFTDSYTMETGKTFADIYIQSMALSSKTSKILKDKLLSDRPAALSMAMVCLLVNIGRMNTTLNCELNQTRLRLTINSLP
jgi:Ino eighty subunit 1